MTDKIREIERQWLFEQEQFRNFLLDIMSKSAIGSSTCQDERALFEEGRRSWELEILSWFADSGDPFETIAVLYQRRKQPQNRSE